MKTWPRKENKCKILNKFKLGSLILFGGGGGGGGGGGDMFLNG